MNRWFLLYFYTLSVVVTSICSWCYCCIFVFNFKRLLLLLRFNVCVPKSFFLYIFLRCVCIFPSFYLLIYFIFIIFAYVFLFVVVFLAVALLRENNNCRLVTVIVCLLQLCCAHNIVEEQKSLWSIK